MEIKRVVSEYKQTFASILLSAIATATLVFSLLSISVFLKSLTTETEVEPVVWVYFGIAFIMYAALNLSYFLKDNFRKLKVLRIVSIAIYLILGVLSFVFIKNTIIITIASILLFVIFAIYNILWVINNHKPAQIVRTVLLTIISLLCSLICLLDFEILVSIIFSSISLTIISLLVIIREAFSKIHFATLKDVIKKTYALEIMLGLVSLIISFSFIFHMSENISYGDALWYSFAIITTIGFGDVSVTSPLSRVLSVILGIYGIIVVAVLTSIIVNFYNETKYIGKKHDEKPSDEVNNQNQEQEQEENK